jgi:hypothetical protein
MTVVFLGGTYFIENVVTNVFSGIFGSSCPELMTSTDVPHAFQLCRVSAEFGSAVWSEMNQNFTAFNNRLNSIFFRDGVEEGRSAPVVGDPLLVYQAVFGKHSDAATAVDIHGNICSVSHSINSATMWGTGIFVDGIALSNAGAGYQNRYYISQNISVKSSPHLLPTPTKPAIFFDQPRNGTWSHFAVSTIGNSLCPVTLQMATAMLLDVSPLNYSVNQGQFLLNEEVMLGNTLNLCDMNCSVAVDPYVCKLMNAQTNCVTPTFAAEIPKWAGSFEIQTGVKRFRNSGLMALNRVRFEESGAATVEGAVTPLVNGGSFMGEA